MTGLPTKRCSICKIEHCVSEFPPHKGMKDGLQTACRASRKKYYEANKTQLKLKSRQTMRRLWLTPLGRAKHLLHGARSRANKKNLDFQVSVEQVHYALESGFCQATGLPFKLSQTVDSHCAAFAPSIDRRDNSKGYIFDNVQVVCNMYNTGKSEHDELDFIAMCVAVAERHQNDARVIARLAELRNGL